LILHHNAAQRRERRKRADRLVDTNLAMCGGDGAKKLLKELRK
jgi:hypothetical protein